MRSCSSPVLVEQTTEKVSSAYCAGPILADDNRLGAWVGRLQAQCPVRAVPVVVLDVDAQDLFQMISPDQEPVQALGADRGDPALRVGVRRGCLHWCVRRILVPSARNTSSKPRQNTFQVVLARRGAGSSPWRRSVVRIAVADAWMPSRSSSPWMRW